MRGNNELINLRRQQESLPVYKKKSDIIHAIQNNAITLIVGETGSGKTTQIPQYLLNWNQVTPQKRIACTQPRTVAATSVATRVAYEQNFSEIGQLVGYQIRLDSRFSDKTKLLYMTEGVLLRKAMNTNNANKYLNDFKVIIIDEAHERTVNADLLMGFLKDMVKQRPDDLRVVVMSATLDTERFKKYFENPPVIFVEGSTFPVQHYWLDQPTPDYVQLTIETIQAIHQDPNNRSQNGSPDGHILVFATGKSEIDKIVTEVNRVSQKQRNQSNSSIMAVPLYSSLMADDRKKAFDEPRNQYCRKCVVATNIAETSLTISNVVYVIDCGLSKQKVYSPSKGIEALGIRPISKASVKQRVGRAGRVKPGYAYHLYTQNGYESLSNETRAEILRSGLISETLSMLALGLKNPLQFDFIDAPDEMTMARAINTLYHLGAIDDNCEITTDGYKMAAFPVNPRMARSILSGFRNDCVFEMSAIAAMLEVTKTLFRGGRDGKKKKANFYHISGDHLTLLNIFNAYQHQTNKGMKGKFAHDNWLHRESLDRACRIKKQIESVLINQNDKYNNENEEKNNKNDNNATVVFKLNDHRYQYYYDNIIQTILSGYFENVAVHGFSDKYWTFRVLEMEKSEHCIDVTDKAMIHPSSIFDKKNNPNNWIMFHEIMLSHCTMLKVVTAIKPSWLAQVNPNYFNVEALYQDRSPIAIEIVNSRKYSREQRRSYQQQHY